MIDGYRMRSGGTGRRSERSACKPSVDLTETGSNAPWLRSACRLLLCPAQRASGGSVAAAGRYRTLALAEPLKTLC